MTNKEKQAENKEKIGIGAWLALIVLILVLSGAFRTAEGPIKVLDFTNLAGSFGQIGDTGANLIGKGGTGAKDGFMAGFNLIPAVMFFCGLLGVFEQLGAFKASDILFRPLLRPLLGIPGKCGIAFISSFTGSDVAAVMTRELYEDGEITDYKMRVENSKLKTVRALQSIGFETVASGDSYNDLGMILAGKSGFLFRTTEQIKADYPQIPALETYEELLNALKEA